MSDAVFRVAADVGDFINKMLYAEKATKKVAAGAASIGTAVSGSIMKVTMLQQALQKSLGMLTQILDTAKSASETSGERAKSLSSSFLSMGFKDTQSAQKKFMEAPGIASATERMQLAKSLAAANRERKAPMSEAELSEALGVGVTGGTLMYGEGFDELVGGVREGRGTSEITQASVAKRPGLFTALSDPSSQLFQGIRAQNAEDWAQRMKEKNLATAGASQRVGEAVNSAAASSEDGRWLSPFLGTLLGSATAGNQDVQSKTYNAIEKQNELLRKTMQQPTLATETR